MNQIFTSEELKAEASKYRAMGKLTLSTQEIHNLISLLQNHPIKNADGTDFSAINLAAKLQVAHEAQLD